MPGRITMLLGAGASIEFIGSGDTRLDSNRLKTALFDGRKWQEAIAELTCIEGESRCVPPETIVSAQGVLRRLKWIQKHLQSSRRQWHEYYENILHILDCVAPYLGSDRMTTGVQIDGALIDLGRDIAMAGKTCSPETLRRECPDACRDEWRHVPFLAREILITTILDLWSASPQDGGLAVYRDFLHRLLQEYDAVSIYTLNHDPLLSESISGMSELTTGFGNAGEFSPTRYLKRDSRGVVAYLHGHVGFVPRSTNTMTFQPDYGRAHRDRMRDFGGGSVGGSTKGLHYNTYIATGLNKMSGFVSQPFATYLARFAYDLQESSDVVIVGCSLSDDHLNGFLTSAVSAGSKRVLYVTAAQSMTGALNPCHPDHILWQLALLGTSTRVYTSGARAFLREESLELAYRKAWRFPGNAEVG